MTPTRAWHELHRCHDLDEANAIATSIAAMEFEVRVVDAATELPVEDGDGAHGPFRIETSAEHREDLLEVLDQIIEEQGEFDERLAARDGNTVHLRRLFFGALVLVVVVLLLLGLVRL